MWSPKIHSVHHRCFICVISFAHQLLFSYALKKSSYPTPPLTVSVDIWPLVYILFLCLSYVHKQNMPLMGTEAAFCIFNMCKVQKYLTFWRISPITQDCLPCLPVVSALYRTSQSWKTQRELRFPPDSKQNVSRKGCPTSSFQRLQFYLLCCVQMAHDFFVDSL